MNDLMLALMVWIHAYTGLPVAEPPSVTIMEACALHRYRLGDVPCPRPGEIRTAGVYDSGKDIILLREGWSSSDLVDVSLLLHELVHHMQNKNGISVQTVACVGRDVEAMAYRAQMAWLESAGVDAHAALGVDEFTIKSLTSCN